MTSALGFDWIEALIAATTPVVPSYEWACDRDDCDGLAHDRWNYPHARTKQRLPEGDWFLWLLLCGRGFGKTRTGSEAFLDMVLDHPVDVEGRATEWLIAGPTFDDTVKLLFEGVSSLKYSLERRKIDYRWLKNEHLVILSTGQRIVMQYAEGHEDLGRGGNWAGVWLDEPGMYKKIRAAWDEALLFSIRAVLPGGWRPRIMLTGTPKTSSKEAFDLLWQIVEDSKTETTTIVTTGTTFENEDNIPPSQIALWKRMFPKGTRSYKQELCAELLRDIEDALWTAKVIEDNRVERIPADAQVVRRIVTIDPATTSGPNSDETGMHLLAKAMHDELDIHGKVRRTPHIYVEKDLTSRVPASVWARVAVKTAYENDADILYEMDQGGDAWKEILETAARELGIPCPKIRSVRAATEGSKPTRANPVADQYRAGYVHHVGRLPQTEEQMVTWVPLVTKKSPDRVDSLVYGVRELLKKEQAAGFSY